MQWLAIVVVSILACVIYGIVHDQITVRICVEYFTIGHREILFIPPRDLTALGLYWGIVATWWVGLLLGVPLAAAARLGSRPKRTVGSIIRPMAVLFGASALFAVLAGVAGYIAASNGWVWLVGSLADSVPSEKHIPFLVNLWAHTGSYLAAAAGGLILISHVWRARGRTVRVGEEH